MLYLLPCPDCRGEGYRTQPPYEYKYHDRPYRWRAKEPCDGSEIIGFRLATAAEIEAHRHAALTDYRLTGVRLVG